MCASVCAHMYLCVYLHLWVTVCIHMCTYYGYVCACMYMGMCMYIYTHMCVCACMCVFIHVHVIEVEGIMKGKEEILWWRGGRRGDGYIGHATTKGKCLGREVRLESKEKGSWGRRKARGKVIIIIYKSAIRTITLPTYKINF